MSGVLGVMRSKEIVFASGRELLNSYWGFLRHGGLVLERDDFQEGEALTLDVKILSLKKSYRLSAKVARLSSEGSRAFVAFDEGQIQDVMLNAAWADSHEVPQRKHRRYPFSTEVRYTPAKTDSDGAARGWMVNLSPGGCCLKGASAYPVGTPLRLVAHGIELNGLVRWTTAAREMGIEFTKPGSVVQALLDEAARLA
jgi:hypothetical protein